MMDRQKEERRQLAIHTIILFKVIFSLLNCYFYRKYTNETERSRVAHMLHCSPDMLKTKTPLSSSPNYSYKLAKRVITKVNKKQPGKLATSRDRENKQVQHKLSKTGRLKTTRRIVTKLIGYYWIIPDICKLMSNLTQHGMTDHKNLNYVAYANYILRRNNWQSYSCETNDKMKWLYLSQIIICLKN